MLTIKEAFGNQLLLGIPNNNVRKQYYEYLLEEYHAAAPRVEALRQGTELHKIIMQFDGWILRRMDEVK